MFRPVAKQLVAGSSGNRKFKPLNHYLYRPMGRPNIQFQCVVYTIVKARYFSIYRVFLQSLILIRPLTPLRNLSELSSATMVPFTTDD